MFKLQCHSYCCVKGVLGEIWCTAENVYIHIHLALQPSHWVVEWLHAFLCCRTSKLLKWRVLPRLLAGRHNRYVCTYVCTCSRTYMYTYIYIIMRMCIFIRLKCGSVRPSVCLSDCVSVCLWPDTVTYSCTYVRRCIKGNDPSLVGCTSSHFHIRTEMQWLANMHTCTYVCAYRVNICLN